LSIFGTDKGFTGSIPKLYEEYLVPMIFESYAVDLVNRIASRPLTRVLEVAAGTGVVSRKLATLLPKNVSIVATDLNQPMLDLASELGTKRPITWSQADALDLPFEDSVFDAVLCQFGVMFFADKIKAFAEARRVLSPGGILIFNVWDRLEENEFAHTVSTALEPIFPQNTPSFMARTPHGYYDLETITNDLRTSGFNSSPVISTVAARSQAASPQIPAIAFCQATPLRGQIEAHGKSLLAEATTIAEQALAQRFGLGFIDGKIQAHIVSIEG
jgi:ubiquinone/menaquinone biosynthesis C-methylase UbiE